MGQLGRDPGATTWVYNFEKADVLSLFWHCTDYNQSLYWLILELLLIMKMIIEEIIKKIIKNDL